MKRTFNLHRNDIFSKDLNLMSRHKVKNVFAIGLPLPVKGLKAFRETSKKSKFYNIPKNIGLPRIFQLGIQGLLKFRKRKSTVIHSRLFFV